MGRYFGYGPCPDCHYSFRLLSNGNVGSHACTAHSEALHRRATELEQALRQERKRSRERGAFEGRCSLCGHEASGEFCHAHDWVAGTKPPRRKLESVPQPEGKTA